MPNKTESFSSLPKSLKKKLQERVENKSLRSLKNHVLPIDFSSNDYLGFARLQKLNEAAKHIEEKAALQLNGATGSRLIRGNHSLYQVAEKELAEFYETENALLFNSGYDANLGLFSSIATRDSIILYDEFCHASIRDGMRLGYSKTYKFAHNNLEDVSRLLEKHKATTESIYVVTEAVFSMDGDGPNLNKLLRICQKYGAYLIVDEAHSNPIFPLKNLLPDHQLNEVFARIVTFGKAFGCHGAAVLGSQDVTTYLVNFARSFIYTTGMPPAEIAKIIAAHQLKNELGEEVAYLKECISFFRSMCFQLKLDSFFIESFSPIQSCVVRGNANVDEIAAFLQQKDFDVRAIKSPTVAKGEERLRICLHSYNFPAEMEALLKNLQQVLIPNQA